MVGTVSTSLVGTSCFSLPPPPERTIRQKRPTSCRIGNLRGVRPLIPYLFSRKRSGVARNVLSPTCVIDAVDPNVVDHAAQFVQHAPLAAGVGLPCTVMNCGDVVYRSTLDPVLRMEQRGITPLGWGILSAITAYLLAPPGALAGLLDFYLLAPIERSTKTRFRQADFVLNKKLGVGAFGVVYKADVQKKDKILDLDENGDPAPVVLKKAKEFGAEEAWMNGRVRRACPSTCAAFIDAFEDEKEGTVLVWKFEGKESFADMLLKKDFPYCMEPYLFSRPLAIPKGPERESVIFKTITSQLLDSLRNLHATGIVHRDVKPQNLIVSEEGKLKLIDLGAAADLRIGINYIPKEFLLDPRYCAPERFIMSTSTPSAPPTPVAALLCPILWQLNKPDKFDMYAVGLILLQMQLPSLRSDNGLIAFRKQLEGCDYDLQAWRKKYTEGRKRIRDYEMAMAGMDESGAWDLISRLMEKRPQDRFSANKALRHPWFSLETASPSVVQAFLNSIDTVATGQGTDFQTWIVNTMAKNGSSEEVGGFTEGQLDEMGYKGSKDEEDEVVALPKFFERQLRRTVVRMATQVGRRPRDNTALNLFKKFYK